MNQIDFVGGLPERQQMPFKDIPNKRPAVADEKAELALKLGRLCQFVPKSVSQGSVQLTRRWVEAQKESMKLLRAKGASVQQLQSALNRMYSFIDGAKA